MLDRIAAGRTDLIFDWINQGGSANAEVDNASLVQWCAYYGDVSGIRFLLGQRVSLEALGANLGLLGAAFHGHWRLCEFLIEHGADANVPDEDTGEVPLHAALCKFESLEHEQVVRVLLAKGADPNRHTLHGADTGSFMRDARTRGETPLHRAAAYGTREAVKLLLDAGARIDARDAHGDSPLSWGSWANRASDDLRLLCFGTHHIREGRKDMRSYLVGQPTGSR